MSSAERLGINGVEEIKAHPFFFGIDWRRIRDKKAPFIPNLKSEVDTENFDKFEEEEPWIHNINKKKRKDGNFVGFTYNRNDENVKSSLLAALLDLEALKPSNTSEKKIVDSNKQSSYQNIQNPTSETLFKSSSSVMLINKTQQLESNFQMNSFKLMEGPPPGLPKKIPLNKNPNSNMNFNRNEFTQNLIKSPKAQLTNIPPSKEESKKYDNNKNNVNTNMLEKLTQNISKNKIIPSFLIQKKIGDNNASTPSSHLKMNNLQTNINKNSMLKTNTNPNTFGLNASLKPNNLFNFSKK